MVGERPTITSPSNPQIKRLAMLAASSKARHKAGETLLEGIHIVADAIACGATLTLLVVNEDSFDNKEVSELVRSAPSTTELMIVSEARFRSFSIVEHGVGVAAVMAVPDKLPLPSVLSFDSLLLDGVQDPGNVGTLLRTAAAAGILDVFCSSDTASVWAPKVMRSGMGAQFGLRLHEGVDLVALIRSATVPVRATMLNENAQSLYSLGLQDAQVWLFGSEGRGVRGELIEAGALPVFIPQTDGVESLNVAAAAAVCLFEQRRQRLA